MLSVAWEKVECKLESRPAGRGGRGEVRQVDVVTNQEKAALRVLFLCDPDRATECPKTNCCHNPDTMTPLCSRTYRMEWAKLGPDGKPVQAIEPLPMPKRKREPIQVKLVDRIEPPKIWIPPERQPSVFPLALAVMAFALSIVAIVWR